MKKGRINILFFISLFIVTFSFTDSLTAGNKVFTVVIDPGHGGNDPGAIGYKGKEKNINLSVALKLGELIECNDPTTKVVYTRKNDTFVPLHTRAEIANKAKADLFISIHTNSLAHKTYKVSGTEVYTLGLHRTQENLDVAKKENAVILIEEDYQTRYEGFNPKSSESYIIFEFMQDQNMSQSVSFAQKVQQEFRHTARRVDRGVHQAGFLVLRETSMPSVLIELGYINNPNEESYLLSSKGTATLAQSIYQAFISYKQQSGYTIQSRSPAPPVYSSRKTDKEQVSEKRQQTNSTQAISLSETKGNSQPVFKIQILTSDKKLPTSHRSFKGLEQKQVSFYKERGIYKYTYGKSTNYNQMVQLLKTKVRAKFKDAFIIAFKGENKIKTNDAIREFKQNK